MQSLTVCLGALVFHPQYAGPAVRFKRYAPGLRGLGINMSVFSGVWDSVEGDGRARRGDGATSPLHVVDGIPIHGISLSRDRWNPGLQARYSRALARFCVESREGVDLVQLLSVSPWGLEGLSRLRRAGIPLVFTSTMLRPDARTKRQRLQRRFANLPYRFLDCVVVSTTVMRDSLRADGIRARMEVIPNGVDLRRFRPLPVDERRVLRERLDLDPDREMILFVGGFLSERKGVDVLAAAWKIVARARSEALLVLVGPHADPVRTHESKLAFVRLVKQMLAESGAEDRVVLTGEVNNVEEYLQAADLFVFPSRREGMPNVVPEAFASGVPTVLTPFHGLPEEFGRPGVHYVLVDRTPEAIAEGILNLLDDPKRREEIAGAARGLVEETLDVDRSLRLYATLYRELAAGVTGP